MLAADPGQGCEQPDCRADAPDGEEGGGEPWLGGGEGLLPEEPAFKAAVSAIQLLIL